MVTERARGEEGVLLILRIMRFCCPPADLKPSAGRTMRGCVANSAAPAS